MNVMVVGGGGFIGRHIVARLVAAGESVTVGARGDCPLPGVEVVAVDLARDGVDAWARRLSGFDAVVNAAGILRGRFKAIHEQGVATLWRACEVAGVDRVIQISALGDPEQTEFIASKHRGDADLMGSALNWTVLRPSVVHSPADAYGGTVLLRALAIMPGWVFVPSAAGALQPVTLEDVADTVLACLQEHRGLREVVELVGPEPISLRRYLDAYRRWLGAGRARFIPVPMPLVGLAAVLGQVFGRGPLGLTMHRMLAAGNVGSADALPATRRLLGRDPLSVEQALARRPAGQAVQWQARLALLRPVARVVVAALWIVSGLIGWLTPDAETVELRRALGWIEPWGTAAVHAAGTLDLVLGGLLLLGVGVRWVLWAMLASVLAYSVALGLADPGLWLEPLGGLIKNGPLAVLLAIMIGLERRG